MERGEFEASKETSLTRDLPYVWPAKESQGFARWLYRADDPDALHIDVGSKWMFSRELFTSFLKEANGAISTGSGDIGFAPTSGVEEIAIRLDTIEGLVVLHFSRDAVEGFLDRTIEIMPASGVSHQEIYDVATDIFLAQTLGNDG